MICAFIKRPLLIPIFVNEYSHMRSDPFRLKSKAFDTRHSEPLVCACVFMHARVRDAVVLAPLISKP
jgi:hypothetical protein